MVDKDNYRKFFVMRTIETIIEISDRWDHNWSLDSIEYYLNQMQITERLIDMIRNSFVQHFQSLSIRKSKLLSLFVALYWRQENHSIDSQMITIKRNKLYIKSKQIKTQIESHLSIKTFLFEYSDKRIH